MKMFRRSKIRRTISFAALILLALGALALPSPPAAAGQETGIRIKWLKVSIWPEYDDPRVLVIYHGVFENVPSFPTWADFYIPSEAELVGAGIDTPEGRMLLQEYKIQQKNGRTVLSVNISLPSFFFEYYYNPFSGGELKSFEQKIENTYPVVSMAVDIQRPLKAEDFSLTPEPVESFTDPRGLTYFKYFLENLKAESSANFMVSYKKDDPHPSIVKKIPITAREGEGSVEQGKRGTPKIITGLSSKVLVGIILIVAAALVAIVMIMRKEPEKKEEDTARREAKQAASMKDLNFCINCGAQIESDYKFCPGCGQPTERGHR